MKENMRSSNQLIYLGENFDKIIEKEVDNVKRRMNMNALTRLLIRSTMIRI